MDIYPTDVVLLLESWIFLASAAQKMVPPPDIWGAPFQRLTCGPTKLERTKGFVNLVNINVSSFSDRTMSIQTAVVLLQPLVFLVQPPKAAPIVPPAPDSRGRLCCRGGLTAPILLHGWPGHPSTHPHPLLFCGDGSLTPPPNQ